jgi:cytochrome c
MPFVAPQSLAPDEVYAITAYVLNLNEIVDDEFVLTQANLAAIEMPNKDGFYVDNRPDVVNRRCMNNCKDPKTIKLISTIKGVTPTDHFKNDGNDGIAFTPEHTVKVDSQVLQTYRSVCQTCHENGLAGAPKPSDHEQWQVRLKQGKETLYLNAINGFNAMPAKGGRVDLSDELVKSIVDYMLNQAADIAEQ